MEKLTIKQEQFCQEYVTNGGNATEAYKLAYKPKNCTSKSINELSSRLGANVKIQSRIKEIQAQTNKKYEITREFITDNLLEVLKGAKMDLNLDLLRKGSMDIAKLHGLIIDKAEIENKGTITLMGSIKLGDKSLEFDVGE